MVGGVVEYFTNLSKFIGSISSTIGSLTSIMYLNLAGNVINGITNRSVTIHVYAYI